MASIISSGIGSGLDIAGLVQQLVAAEAAPVERRIAIRESRVQSKLSAFGNLKSALSQFRDQLDAMRKQDGMLKRKGVSGNEDLFTVSVDKNALPARYTIDVRQLAQAQRLTSAAFADSATAVGTGTLTIAVGTESFSIQVTDENNTLAGIRDSINAALDNSGVAATIVNADAGSYLILTAGNSGVDNSMTVTQSGGDGGLAALEYDPGNGLNSLLETIAAQDALARIDGFDVYSNTNKIEGAIDGVTLNLVSANPGVTASLDVSNDQAAVRESVDSFVAKYNALVKVLDDLTAYDAESQKAGPLLGDTMVRSIREQIRRELSTAVSDIDADFTTLGQVGIEVQLDGTLLVDSVQLNATLNEDFTRFGRLFTASDGYAVRIYNLTESYLRTDGILQTRTKGLNSQIEGFGEQRESLNERLASFEARLSRQFNALDSLLGQLTQTSVFLNQQLSNLPGFTSRRSNN